MENISNGVSEEKFSSIGYLSGDSQRLKILIVIAVALIAFVITGIWYVHRYANSLTKFHTATDTTDIIIQSNFFPPISVVELRGILSKNLMVPGQGTAVLVGIDESSSTNPYYLIMDPVSRVTNLYTRLTADPTSGLVQQTNSRNQKIYLTVDQLSGRAAYLTAPIASTTTLATSTATPILSTSTNGIEGEIVVWDPMTKEEIFLGKGSDPMLLHGGQYILFSRDGKLITMQIQNQKEFPLATLQKGDVFGFDSQNQNVGIYYALSSTTNIYSIAGISNLTYVSSYKPKEAPLVLIPYDGAFLSGVLQKDIIALIDASGKAVVSFALVLPNISADAIYIRHE